MAERRLGIIMHGVTGRMGENQHLVRSILAIRAQGGVKLSNGDTVMPDPLLVGRNPEKVKKLAEKHGVVRWTADMDQALANQEDELFFDAASTTLRPKLLARAIEAGKNVYCEKPIAENLNDAMAVVHLAEKSGIKSGVVHDKLFLPGLKKLMRLREEGFFGKILSVRGEFGYWVFEGDEEKAQRPSWNYRKKDGGSIITDMLCHWRYVLDHVVAPVKAVNCLGVNHIKQRFDEAGKPYSADADDAAYTTFELEGDIIAQFNSSWCTRVRRDDLVTFHIDGTKGSAVAGLTKCYTQSLEQTPRPTWNPDEPQKMNFFDQWQLMPDEKKEKNGFKVQWEMFIRHLFEGAPWEYTLREGAKGVQLAELGIESWEQRRWVDVPPLKS